MQREQMHFLNAGGVLRRNADVDIGRVKRRSHAAPVTSGQCNDAHAIFVSRAHRCEYILRIAARRSTASCVN